MNKVNSKRVLVLATVVTGLLVWNFQTSSADEYSTPPEQSKKKEMYYVIDASYIDHSGEYADCIEYADRYKDYHDYVVVSAKTVIGDTAE